MSVIELKYILQEKLKQKRMNVSELEKEASLATGSVRRIMVGNTQNPTIETMLALANVFGCTVDDLLGNKSKKNKENISISEDVPWNNELMNEIFLATYAYIKEKEISPSLRHVIHFMLETLGFCSEKKNNTFDKDFFEWYAFQKFS